MAKLQKFLFEVDFDAPAGAEENDEDFAFDEEAVVDEPEPEPPPPPPPMFSEEELTMARAQALEAGREAGRMEAEAATERLLANSMAVLGASLREIGDRQQAANEDLMRDAIQVAIAVVKKLQPELAREHALEEITGVIRECLAHIEKDVRVTVRVNPEHLEAIRDHGTQAAEETGFEGKLVYTGDPRILPGDCRVEWGDGGMERDPERLWSEVDATVARALGIEPAAVDEDAALYEDGAQPA